MPLTELEARAYQSDMQVRVVILSLLEHKAEIARELSKDDISVLKEEQLKSALSDVESQINQYKHSGTF